MARPVGDAQRRHRGAVLCWGRTVHEAAAAVTTATDELVEGLTPKERATVARFLQSVTRSYCEALRQHRQ